MRKPADNSVSMPNKSNHLFMSYLQLMVEQRASDLFITCGIAPSLKIDGEITQINQTIITPQQSRTIAHQTMTPKQRIEFEKTNECNFAISCFNKKRFRVNVFRQQGHVGMVVRKIEFQIPTIGDLGLPPLLNKLAMAKRGLIFFVGATGVGKSTSLAAMIGTRNRHSSGHIICIEDPIEFIHKHDGCIITQREVGLDTDSYEPAVKNALRQAPDVILIGEIRSRETMEHALTFAETGHLCLSTLHASNAELALERMINLFPKERRQQVLMDISLNLNAIIVQRLIPKLNGEGRQVALEIMVNTPLVSELIAQDKLNEIRELIKKSSLHGMTSFDQSVYKLYKQGIISYSDALQYADSSNEMRIKIKLGTDLNIQHINHRLSDITLADAS